MLALVGCSGAQHPAAKGADCRDVAVHMLRLAEEDSQATAGGALAPGLVAELERQCRETPWSSARRDCLLAAATQDHTLACPRD